MIVGSAIPKSTLEYAAKFASTTQKNRYFGIKLFYTKKSKKNDRVKCCSEDMILWFKNYF